MAAVVGFGGRCMVMKVTVSDQASEMIVGGPGGP